MHTHLVVKDPVLGNVVLPTRFNTLWDSFLTESIDEKSINGTYVPKMWMEQETDTEYLLKVPIPGVEPEDINVTLDGRMLNISVDKSFGGIIEGNGYTKGKIGRIKYEHRRLMDKDISFENIDSKYTNGVLELMVKKPLAEDYLLGEPKKIDVKSI